MSFHNRTPEIKRVPDRLPRALSLVIAALLCSLLISHARAAEVIPPKPPKYFNDFARVVPAPTATRLNSKLEDFERQTSSQIVVAVYPKMQSDSSIEDYTVRVAQSWRVGQKGKNNGAVLFVFIQDRSMFLQVGYGLEGAIPDATAHQIIEYDIKPHFRNGDYADGLTAGVEAILKAAKGEYKGTGRTVAEDANKTPSASPLIVFAILFGVFFLLSRLQRSGRTYSRRGYGFGGGWGGGWPPGGGGGSGGGFGGGGGFSGGGGSFGGGGAGGRW